MNLGSHRTYKPDYKKGGQEHCLPRQHVFMFLVARTGASSQQAV
jgi:hypothetical protein